MTNATNTMRNRILVAGVVFAAVALVAALIFALAGCAPKQVSEPKQETDPMADVVFEWKDDADCAACHKNEEAMMADASCAQANLHADLECFQCHTDTSKLAEVHNGVTYGQAVPEEATLETVDAATCQDPECHGTMEEMAELTKDSTALVDEKGKVQNPHEFTSGEQHDANQPQCTDCHKIHSEELEKDAMMWCAQCHHKGVFQCGTCHELRQRAVS